MNKTILLIAIVLCSSIHLMGQSIACFDFEDLPAGVQIGPASGNSPGDILFSESGIRVAIQEIQYPDGSTGFLNAEIVDANSGGLDGQSFFMGNNSLYFDLSQADGSINQLCFDFADGGGVENFAVNGSSTAVVEDFAAIAGLTFPGVTVEIDLNNASGFPATGTVCITGNIENLLIGGQEFGIDNVCVDAVLDCPIANLQAEIVDCGSDGSFDIEVDFDWLSPLTVIQEFDIFVEGELVAFINQTELPYLLEDIQVATDALDFTLTVCQNDNPDCCESIVLLKQCPSGSCMAFEGLMDPIYGGSTGTPAGVEIYNESDIGLLLIPFQSLFWTTTYGDLIVLNESNNPEMTAASGQYLKFESVNGVFDLTGYPEAVDSVVVDFYYAGGAVNLAVNGSNILIQNNLSPGLFALAPGITLRVVFDPTIDREGQLIFSGNVQSLLIGGAGDFRIDNLCVNPVNEPCQMDNLTVDLGPCNADGNFLATVNFDYQGVSSDSFFLFGDGVQGNFAFADLPVTVGPVSSNNSGVYAFYAADIIQDGCWVGDTIQAIPCTDCAFEGLSIDYLGLSDNGQNIIELDFNLVGPTLIDFYSIYFDGVLYETYGWADVPVQIRVPCDAATDFIQEITVCEGEDHCCATLPLIFLEPCIGPCNGNGFIQDVSYYLTDCNDAGNYAIVIEEIYPNPPNLAFLFAVSVDGIQVGTFSSANLPIDLGPYPGNGSEHEVAVYTQNTTNCAYEFTTVPVNCSGGNCPLVSAQLISDVQCDGSDFYRAELHIEGAAAGDVLTITSALTGVSNTIVYNGNFVVVEMPLTGQFYDQLTICLPLSTTNEFCCIEVYFDYWCPPCEIYDVQLEPLDCNDDGTYFFVLDFEAVGEFGSTFFVMAGNNYNESFGYDDLPVTLGPLPGNGQPVNVWINDETQFCQVDLQMQAPDCGLGNCFIEPILEAVCTPNGGYSLYVDLEHDGTGNEFVIDVANSNFRDTIAYSDLPLTLFIPSNALQDNIRICDIEHPDCCASVGIDINCPCPWFGGVTITPNDCRDDGTFTAMLNITTPAPSVGDIFIVESDNYLEEFAFADLPVEIGPFFGTGAPQTVFVFIPGTDCQELVTFITPDCGNGGCIFTSVIAEPYGCDGGQFMVDVEVQVNNPGASGYFIFADGQISGPHSYNAPFVTLGPFDGDAMTVYDFLILDIDNPSCFGYAELGPIDCGMVCDIYNLLVQPLGCNDDGTYNVFLNFDVDNPGNDFFEVYGRNGNLIEYYSLNDLPIVIEGLSPSSTGEGYLRVCINDRPNCCEVIEFPEPDCPGDCRISDVQADFAYCDDAGNFYVNLSFNVQNPESDGFRVFGNGQDYGIFGYNIPFPVLVGPIAPTGALAYELIVADLANPDCHDFVEFGAFNCDDDPVTCITFDEFETFAGDTIRLALDNPVDSIYDEDEVVLNAVAIPFPNGDYFESVYGVSAPACNFNTDGGNLWINGGIEMDFGHFPQLPDRIIFDLSFCSSPNTIPVIAIGVNGELFTGAINNLPDELPGGISLEYIPLANTGHQGQIVIEGPVESLLIGGQHIFLDNICFNQPPPPVNDDCISFDIYDGSPTDTLADYGLPTDMEYEEDGVIVTAQRLEWDGVEIFTGVFAYDDNSCGFSDDDASLSFGGALRFNFAQLSELPTSVSFDLAFCEGQAQNLLLKVNGEEYRGPIDALPGMLANLDLAEASPSANDGTIWHVELTGIVESFVIGGNELAIDDICFATPPQLEEVWPGDANADNIAHHIDLLNIGLAYGSQGAPRFEDGASWSGVTASDWTQDFADGTNFKHADCNGDGFIDDVDRQVLLQNYGLTHGPMAAITSLPGTDIDPPAYIDFPAQVPVGSFFNIPIIVGTDDLPMQDVYGVAFTVVYDPEVIDASALDISYPVSWFGEPGVNTISIDRTYAADGRIELAITRTDQNNVSGYGPVAHLIGIIDDIAGLKQHSAVSIENVMAIGVNEELIPVQGRTIEFDLQHKEEAQPAASNGVFSVFPNPTTGWVTVTSKYDYQPEQLTLLTLDGREIKAPQEENRRISLEGLPGGTYILSIRTGNTRVHKLIVKD